jgi:hypothetical protein
MSTFSPEVQITNTPLPIEGGNVNPVAISGPVSVTNFPASQPVSGSVSVSNFPASQPVTGPLTNTELRATPVPVTAGSIATATVTPNAVGVVAVNVLASRAARTKFVVYNETGTLFVKLGSGASSTDYSMRLTANTSWEFSGYSGIVSAIKQSGTTNVQVSDI